MPTEPLALLVYIFLLLPGFCFALARTHHRPEVSRSAFRETTSAVFVSVVCDAAVFLVLLLAAAIFSPLQPLFQRAVLNFGSLLDEEFALASISLIGAVTAASVLAFFLGGTWVQAAVHAIFGRGAQAEGSAWHHAFGLEPAALVTVSAVLQDDTWVQGALFSYNTSAVDAGDRSLLLSGRLLHRRPGEDAPEELEGGTLVLSDRQIKYMVVSYSEFQADAGVGASTGCTDA